MITADPIGITREGSYVDVYTTLEGHINYKGRLPKDNLGNPIIYQGVRFLDQSGLPRLNRLAATFLIGDYDEDCYTREVDAAILREALADFHGCEESAISCKSLRARP
jgi:hypothetical protein